MHAPTPSADGVAERNSTVEAAYDVLGVGVRLRSADRASIDLIDESFGVFRISATGGEPMIELRADDAPGAYAVVGPDGVVRRWRSSTDATLDLMDQLVRSLILGLQQRGLFAVHAAAVAHRGRAVILAGPSGAGKTTLALGLAARGLELLSDELAVLDPATRLVHPYRRRLHIRPGTPQLVDGLEEIGLRERRDLGGGIAWAVGQEEVAAPADGPRPLSGVLILVPRTLERFEPVITAIGSGRAALELLRGTPAASVDFPGALRAIGSCVAATRCALLEAAHPMVTADAIVAWLERSDG